jgi:hypothetical protein
MKNLVNLDARFAINLKSNWLAILPLQIVLIVLPLCFQRLHENLKGNLDPQSPLDIYIDPYKMDGTDGFLHDIFVGNF